MSIFIGGAVALIIGIIGLIVWWSDFVTILLGIIPIFLIFAGALAVYLSFDQFKAWKEAKKHEEHHIFKHKSGTDVEELKKENEELRRQLGEQINEGMKSDLDDPSVNRNE